LIEEIWLAIGYWLVSEKKNKNVKIAILCASSGIESKLIYRPPEGPPVRSYRKICNKPLQFSVQAKCQSSEKNTDGTVKSATLFSQKWFFVHALAFFAYTVPQRPTLLLLCTSPFY
jgi:hypothetical protein